MGRARTARTLFLVRDLATRFSPRCRQERAGGLHWALPLICGSLLEHSLLLRLTTPAHVSTTPSFHSIPHKAGVRRRSAPSSRCFESEPEDRAPRIILLLMRASDTALESRVRNNLPIARHM